MRQATVYLRGKIWCGCLENNEIRRMGAMVNWLNRSPFYWNCAHFFLIPARLILMQRLCKHRAKRKYRILLCKYQKTNGNCANKTVNDFIRARSSKFTFTRFSNRSFTSNFFTSFFFQFSPFSQVALRELARHSSHRITSSLSSTAFSYCAVVWTSLWSTVQPATYSQRTYGNLPTTPWREFC